MAPGASMRSASEPPTYIDMLCIQTRKRKETFHTTLVIFVSIRNTGGGLSFSYEIHWELSVYQVASVYQVVCMRPVYQVVSGPHTKYSGRLVLIRNTLGVWSSYEIQWESSDLCIAPVYHPCVSPLCIKSCITSCLVLEIQWASGPHTKYSGRLDLEIQWASGPRTKYSASYTEWESSLQLVFERDAFCR